MTLQDQPHDRSQAPRGPSRNSRVALVFAGFAVIAGALLFTEHRAHVLGLLAWLPILACLLMHFFMHGRHHHGHRHGNESEPRSP